MNRFYPYSVKALLRSYFGKDPVSGMRGRNRWTHGEEKPEDLAALLWLEADRQACSLDRRNRFLTGTEVRDEYIAYRFLNGNREELCLLFVTEEEDLPLRLDPAYAEKLLRTEKKRGYCRVSLLIACMKRTEKKWDPSRRLRPECWQPVWMKACGVERCGGIRIFAETIPEWERAVQKKLVSVSESGRDAEYECLFHPGPLLLSFPKDRNRITGRETVREAFEHLEPLRAGWTDRENTGIFRPCILTGQSELRYSLRGNLVSCLRVERCSEARAFYLDADETPRYGSLLERVPALAGVRMLDPEQIYGYGIRLSYADGTERNYYIRPLDGECLREDPDTEGYAFDAETVRSARVLPDGSVSFSNGCRIPGHHLFYRSFRQLVPEKTGPVLYEDGEIRVVSAYRTPYPDERLGHYQGSPEEKEGPAFALLDCCGDRVSDAAFLEGICFSDQEAAPVTLEPDGNAGFVRKDGTWAVPPVYETASFDWFTGIVEGETGGRTERYLVTEQGALIPGDWDDRIWGFSGGSVIAVSTGEPEAKIRDRTSRDFPEPLGNWGLYSAGGRMLARPQYACIAMDEEHGAKEILAAKILDGCLLWGILDENGRETVPFRWLDLHFLDNALAYQDRDSRLYGVMDTRGNRISDPLFRGIASYDPVHGLVAAGEESGKESVCSAVTGKQVLPGEYYDIRFEKECIVIRDDPEQIRLFGYGGEEIRFRGWDPLEKCGPVLIVRKGRKKGAIGFSGNIIVRPKYDSLHFLESGDRVFFLTAEGNRQGLLDGRGKRILPERYSRIFPEGRFLRTVAGTGFGARQQIYTREGNPVYSGLARRFLFNSGDGTIVVQTPAGKEYLRVTEKNHDRGKERIY